uniref:ZMYM2-like/QRICH1 C-terminal domain-containing protein n=1 Tax=Amphimedon queenslandica TaxID=400682 RepID=A0A1X7VFI6_AMPQE
MISIEEDEELWSKRVMSVDTPNGLLNAIFFTVGYNFVSGGSEHRDIKLSQFELRKVRDPGDGSKMTKCVVYTEFGSKNRHGLVHQVHLDIKVVTQYADECLGERCYFRSIFPNFLSLLKKMIYFTVRQEANYPNQMKSLGIVTLLLGITFLLKSSVICLLKQV